MQVRFKELEEYLSTFGYPFNELMCHDSFEIPELTAYEYLMQNIRNFDGVDAITFFGKKIKYGDLAEIIDRTANALKGIGLSDGQRVATLLPNIPEAAYIQYGASKIGAVPSNIDPRTSGKLLLNYIKNERIKGIVVVDVMYESTIRPIERELKEQYGIDKIIVIPVTSSMPFALQSAIHLKEKIKHVQPIKSEILEIVYWNQLIENTKYECAMNVGFKPDREAVVQHSSGTVKGIPKSIPLTNENINSFVEKHIPTLFSEFPHGTKMLDILPYFASYGAINTSHLGLNLGLTLQQIPEFKFEDFGLIASKQKSEILIGTPTWFALMAKDTRLKSDALKHVKIAISGGDTLDEKSKIIINEFLRSHGANCGVTNGHGMSELSGSGCYQFPNHENGVGIGIPFPYDKYIVLDKDGNIVPMSEQGIKGCAWIYSPSATPGIFEKEHFLETKDIKGFRFINSKDTIQIMPNYELTFIEREDRAFARFDGHKIVPFDIESLISKNAFVKKCMIVPYEDAEIKGKMPIAYIVPIRDLTDDEMDALVSDIINDMFESESINNRDIPRKMCFITKMPVNAMSKNDFVALTNRMLDGTEYTIDIEETNLTFGRVSIYPPSKREKVKVMKLEQAKKN